ncbi:hypothetical protein B0T19DRAFT_175986 [Cercophora scortea]|uniref:Uncharacterized protein n=1 Tax=Cercophora scortea TaxID=314031 RepID=A0AAE0IMP5_9PEZI|nr:hypothetical protein B0T19DRAFT_175986 [Cercophora scortea]
MIKVPSLLSFPSSPLPPLLSTSINQPSKPTPTPPNQQPHNIQPPFNLPPTIHRPYPNVPPSPPYQAEKKKKMHALSRFDVIVFCVCLSVCACEIPREIVSETKRNEKTNGKKRTQIRNTDRSTNIEKRNERNEIKNREIEREKNTQRFPPFPDPYQPTPLRLAPFVPIYSTAGRPVPIKKAFFFHRNQKNREGQVDLKPKETGDELRED